MPAGPLRDKFKKDTVLKILKDISLGVPYQIAAEKWGVHESTFRDWRAKGKLSLKENRDDAYADMVRSLRSIEANRISVNLNEIRESDRGHKGKEWELERSFWKYFSSKAAEIELNERVDALENKKGEQDGNAEEEKKEDNS